MPCKPRSNVSRTEVVQNLASASIKAQEPSPKDTIRLAQAQGGRKISLTLGSAKVKSPRAKMSARDLMSLKKQGNFTERGIKQIGAAVNKQFKKGSIEPKYQQMIREANSLFDPHIKECSVTVKGKSYDLVHVRDLSEYMLDVCRIRKVDPQQQLFRILIDKGQEFNKFSLSIVDLDEEESERIGNKTSGVNKMHLFAITVCDESHDLFDFVILKVNFYDCQYTFVGDLKAINLFCGIMICSSSWPCYACEINKDNLENEGELKTIGSLVENYERYKQNLLKLD